MTQINYAVNDANLVAQFFLAKTSLTQKQIHKLLFFAYQEYLKENNGSGKNLQNALFENKFQAWIHGPVHVGLYGKYAGYGSSLIEVLSNTDEINLSDAIKAFLGRIFDKYGKLTGDQMEYLSHQNVAWINARGDASPIEISKQPISNEDIFNSEIASL